MSIPDEQLDLALLAACSVDSDGLDGATIAARADALRAAVDGERVAGAAVFDDHMEAEFEQHDIEATMATMVDDPYVNHVPTMVGGVGSDEVRRFYQGFFLDCWPQDTTVTPVSRTIDANHVIDEVVISFTHDIEMPAIIPGVEPSGREVTIAFCVVVGMSDGKVAHEHIYWDQASVLVQIGLIDPAGLPVGGANVAAKLIDPRGAPRNELLGGRLDAGVG